MARLAGVGGAQAHPAEGAMRNSAPIGKSTRTTWRTDVREIAAALGIPVAPDQWIVIESGQMDEGLPLDGAVDIVRWERVQPSTYQHELATPSESIAPA